MWKPRGMNRFKSQGSAEGFMKVVIFELDFESRYIWGFVWQQP